MFFNKYLKSGCGQDFIFAIIEVKIAGKTEWNCLQ